MMQAKQPQGPGGPMYPPPPSSFNFTYVEEGGQMNQQHMPPQQMPPQMMGHHQMQMQYPPMNTFNFGYPPPPPAHMMPPPPAHMHSPPVAPQNPGPSEVAFPPLGAAAPSGDKAPEPQEK